MIRWWLGLLALSLAATQTLAAGPTEIGVGYLARAGVKSTLSLVEQPAADDGLAGARLAIDDNNTTGRFLNQHFTLTDRRLKEGEDVVAVGTALAEKNSAAQLGTQLVKLQEHRTVASRQAFPNVTVWQLVPTP